MPDSGSPEPVDPPSGADQGVQVRVIPVPPRDGQTPREVLQNFLDASISDEHDYQTAREYLTPEAVRTWQPDTGAVILNTINLDTAPGDGDPDHATVTLQSSEIATLDGKHTYRAKTDPQYSAVFSLTNVTKDTGKDAKETADKAQWRITDLPTALILNQTNFRNAYQQADRYFFTRPDPGAPPGADQPVLVPDPIFVRRRIDPASAAAQALKEGPSDWLAPVVRSAFDGTSPAATVNTDDPHQPKLQIDGADFQTGSPQCGQMAAQLYFTLLSLSGPSSLDNVTLTAKRGSCEYSPAQARTASWAPGSLTAAAVGGGVPYARNAQTGQLIRLDNSAPVPGVLGASSLPATLRPAGGAPLGAFAVQRDGRAAAVVSTDGKGLYQVPLDDTAKQLGGALVTSRAPSPEQGLGSPSWDGSGGLWVVDRDPSNPQVWLIRGSSRSVVPVDLPPGQTVDSIRLSSDGTRAALLLGNSGTAAHSLAIGLVVRGGSGQPAASITGIRPIAPLLSDVTSVSWADPDVLLALGKESDSVPQLHYVSTDGSGATDNVLQAVDGMTVVASSEDRGDQVLADSKDQGVYSLSGSTPPQWKSYNRIGAVLPAYPG
ncbi:LpqB family beta-propeller domain-containing protein [Kitasatospora sp. NBC_01287]|uniref:LpqB family beta-propeller domain-containing protein n=1 Tax=Kitasatospora sp. NBC_01287 TaxID=2903573 RepID=UPI002255C7DB|nr:LpqB family beta-propeller domain-containing protein [Kitasatospora sp. NBC_01287]MCX4748711.1 LpqB family beta-propeller domain-containing protein [Kitasatospora sp. NBC_01287]